MADLEVLPGGIIACLKPGATLTDDDRAALTEFAQFLADRRAIEAQYTGPERDAKLDELRDTYETAHDAHMICDPRSEP